MTAERAITAHEARIVRWMLEHAAMRDLAAYREVPVDQLRVVGGCNCGCCSLDFSKAGAAAVILADAVAVYADRQQAGLILWGSEAAITSLEVYDLHPGASERVPKISDLRTWEERGQEE